MTTYHVTQRYGFGALLWQVSDGARVLAACYTKTDADRIAAGLTLLDAYEAACARQSQPYAASDEQGIWRRCPAFCGAIQVGQERADQRRT